MLLKSLRETFGFEHFLAGQQEIVQRVLASESAVAIFPTGAGKSLCYQLPALHLPGLTLVVSPLLSLMKDQVDFLVSKNIPAAKLDSGMTREEYLASLQAARDGKIKNPHDFGGALQERTLPASAGQNGHLPHGGGRGPLHLRVGAQFQAGLSQAARSTDGNSTSPRCCCSRPLPPPKSPGTCAASSASRQKTS